MLLGDPNHNNLWSTKHFKKKKKNLHCSNENTEIQVSRYV